MRRSPARPAPSVAAQVAGGPTRPRRWPAAASASARRSLSGRSDLDRRRVDAAQHGEVERDEVAEQHEREHALDRGLAARLDARGRRRRRVADQLAVSSMRARDARVRVGSRRGRPARSGPSPAAPAQPTISLWSSSGSSCGERVLLGVLVDLRLPAVGDRRRSARRRRSPGSCRAARGRASWPGSSSARRAPTRRRAASRCSAATSISERIRGPAPHSGGDLERGDGHVADGGARLKARRRPGSPGRRRRAPPRRAVPPVVTTTRRAPSAPAAS